MLVRVGEERESYFCGLPPNRHSTAQHNCAAPRPLPTRIEPEFLQYFWDLASVDEARRKRAARTIVTELQKPVKAANAGNADDDSESDSDAGEAASAHRLAYTLKRLIRGMCSSRDGARQGFCLALTELLVVDSRVTPTEVMRLMREIMVTAGTKGQARPALFASRSVRRALLTSIPGHSIASDFTLGTVTRTSKHPAAALLSTLPNAKKQPSCQPKRCSGEFTSQTSPAPTANSHCQIANRAKG